MRRAFVPFFAVALLALVAGCGASSTSTTSATETVTAPTNGSTLSETATTETATTAGTPSSAPQVGGSTGTTFPGGKKPVVVIDTSMGQITLELEPAKAPITVQNFLTYVRADFYDGTIFHRVIPGFMIQGGGFTPDLQEKPTRAPIKNEAANGLTNKRGTIAMARTQQVDSATSQFFINVADNATLDHTSDSPQEFGYAVFGRVTQGMDVVDKIVTVPTTTKGPYENVPVTPVVIKSIKEASGT
jgi:peptidyl-prolyl cis-trans isomerase A (cyclophilin A)